MTCAKATINHADTGIWSALIEWPFGYRFVSAIDLQGLTARIDSVAFAIGRRVECVRGRV
jgi:hypothetical protein